MPTTPSTENSPEQPSRRALTLRRLHSLTGVVPLGVFLVAHLYTNTRALYGRDVFNRALADSRDGTLFVWLELFALALPLTFHALYGLVIAARTSPGVVRDGTTRNWLYLFQRVSGVAALAFILWHVWQYRAQRTLGGLPWQGFYGDLARSLEAPAMFAAYALGLSAVVFHFAHGLWLFGSTWKLTVSAAALRRSALACAVVGIALWALGFNTLLHFTYRCGGVLPIAHLRVVQACADVDSAPAPDP